MEILIKALQLILSLSILVVFHEAGHFVAARIFKTRVEKFYLFFDPWFSIFKFKYKDTEYGMGWLPLGGYVKISGMIDESMDKEQMKEPAKPWEFRSKPAWQRLIIMLGGVTVNLILGFLIYSMLLFAYGEKYIPNENLKDGIWVVDDLASDIGLETGDKILTIDGDDIRRVNDIMPMMLLGKEISVERNGKILSIEIPTDFAGKLVEGENQMLLYPRMPFTLANVPDSALNSGVIQAKDQILAIGGNQVKYFDQFKGLAEQYANESVSLKVKREDAIIDLTVKVDSAGRIGALPALYGYDDLEKGGVYEFQVYSYGFFESFPAGWDKAMDKLGFYVKQMKLIFNPETGAYKGVGGFGAIGNLFPAEWSWRAFWEITAFLSLILAFMNILPIPALDGGHVLFLTYEIITGRPPSEKFLEYAQIVGMILLLSLLVFANGNDLIKAIT
jgi:regulator of sigma E protease